MDKYEYNVKLEQIKKLIKKKDYATAARIADTIDWYKVKNNQTIIMIADVYEASGRYEQSRENLKLAYDRSGLGRQIAYKLVKVCIKCGALEEAEDFYDDFVSTAPKDISKYILEYELAKAKGDPLDKQISILEQYLEEDMDDKWAFELAKLYHKSGQRDKCIRQCDTVMLWFSDGKYVEKAMELKMIYTPLNKSQRERYEAKWREKSGQAGVDAEEIHVKEVDVANKYNTQNIQAALKESMDEIYSDEKKENNEGENIFRPTISSPEYEEIQDEYEYSDEALYEEAEETAAGTDDYIYRMNQNQQHSQESFDDFEQEREEQRNDLGDTKVFVTTRSKKNLGDTKIFAPIRQAVPERISFEETADEANEAYILEEKTIKNKSELLYEEDFEENLDEAGENQEQPEENQKKIWENPEDIDGEAEEEEFPEEEFLEEFVEEGEEQEFAEEELGEEFAEEGEEEGFFMEELEEEFVEEEFPEEEFLEEFAEEGEEEEFPEEGEFSEKGEKQEFAEEEELLEEGEEQEFVEEGEEQEFVEEGEEQGFFMEEEFAEEEREQGFFMEEELVEEEEEFSEEELEEEFVQEEEELTEEWEEELPIEETEEMSEPEELPEEIQKGLEKFIAEDNLKISESEPESAEAGQQEIPKQISGAEEAAVSEEPEAEKDFEKPLSIEDFFNNAGRYYMSEKQAEDKKEPEISIQESMPEEEKSEYEKPNPEYEEQPEETAELKTEYKYQEPEEAAEPKSEYEYQPKTGEVGEPEEGEDKYQEDQLEAEEVKAEYKYQPELEESEPYEYEYQSETEELESPEKLENPYQPETQEPEYEYQPEAEESEYEQQPEPEEPEYEYQPETQEPEYEYQSEAEEPEYEQQLEAEELEALEESENQYEQLKESDTKQPEEYESVDDLEEEDEVLTHDEIKAIIRDFIGKYSGVQGLDKQMLKTLQNIIVDDSCNIIIMGDAKSGKTSLGLDIIKVVNKIKRNNNRRIAKISADKLIGKELSVYFTRLRGSDIYIENISLMDDDTVAELLKAMNKDVDNRIVVIEDEKVNAEKFLDKHNEIRDYFANQIVVKQNKIRDWVEIAREYAEEQGYQIDEMGMLALHAKIDQLYAITLVIQKNHVDAIIDSAIKKASKGGLFKKLFGKKKEKILTEEHFSL